MANETVVRVSVDATGFEAGTERARRSAEVYVAAQEEMARATQISQAAVVEATANGSTASVRSINALVQQAARMSATYGMNARQALAYKASIAGVSDAIAPYLEKMDAIDVANGKAAASTSVMAESSAAAATRIASMVEASMEAAAAINSSTVAADRYAASVEAIAIAASAAEKSNAGIASSATAAATAQTEASVLFAAASTTVSAGAEKVAEALGRQLTALTASKAQMIEYDAQMAGFTAAETEQVAAIAKEIDLRKQQIAIGEKMAATYAVTATAAHGAEGATSGVTSEIGVLGREAMSGNFSRMAGSFTRLLSLAGALELLLNPLSLSVAAVGYAMYTVASQNEKMNEALVMTGGYAGVTADQLRSMATAATAGGATFNTASEAVTALAATGRLTGDEIANLGKSAADAATFTSMSVKQMVDDFTKLADEPLKASVQLNDQYHYLTVATYDQIAALEKQGDATGAAKVAVDAFSLAMDERTKEIAANQGIILSGWRDIKAMINGALEAVGSFGAAATPGQIVARLQDNKSARSPIGQWSADDEAELKKAIATRDSAVAAAQAKARADRQNQEIIDAKHSYDTWNSQFASPAERRAKEIQKYVDTIATPLNLSPEQQLADEAQINAKYPDKKAARTPRAKAVTDDAGTRMLQQLRDQQASLDAQLSTTDKLTNSESQLAKFNQQISDWTTKTSDGKTKVLTAEQKSLIGDQEAIRNQLEKNAAKEQEVQYQQDINKLQERSAQIASSMENYQKNQTEQYGRELDAFGMGSDALKNAQAVKSIYAEYQRDQDQLAKAAKGGTINSDEYAADSAKIKAGLDQSLKDYDTYYDSLKTKQADWTNGASAALANYMDSAHNMAAQTESTVTDMAKGMEDALVSFATTGKLNFSSLVNSIIADIARMQARAAVSGLFSSIVGLVGGSFGNGAATFAANVQGGNTLDNLVNNTGGWGTVPARVSGGSVAAGTTYMVGEKGPELFNPGSSGTITPNHALGGSVENNVEVNIHGAPPGTQVQQSRNSNGGLKLDVIMEQVDQYMAKGFRSGKTKTAQAVQGQYGLNRLAGT